MNVTLSYQNITPTYQGIMLNETLNPITFGRSNIALVYVTQWPNAKTKTWENAG